MKAWRLLAPAIIVLIAVTAWPLGRAAYHSLFRYQYTAPDGRTLVWFDNYVALATSSTWWQACALVIGLMTAAMIVQLLLGFGFATVLRRVVRLQPIVRILILVPAGIMMLGSSLAWRDAMTTGYLNTWFRLDGLADSAWGSLLTILLAEVWSGTGIVTLLLLTGLMRVPDSLLRSAIADGATPWQRFWRIIVPAAKPAIAVAIVYRVVASLATFDSVYAVADPAATSEVSVPATLIIDASISRFELGLGSAMSMFLLILTGLIGVLFLKALQLRRVL